jgi:hypothetical protein
MCAELNSIEPAGEGEQAPSPACGNTRKSRSSKSHAPVGDDMRRAGRRKYAGRNAKPEGSSVKAIEPRETYRYVVAEPLLFSAKAVPRFLTSQMRSKHHRGPRLQHAYKGRAGNSGALSRVGKGSPKFKGQGVMTESRTNLSGEIRCRHSSWEVVQ